MRHRRRLLLGQNGSSVVLPWWQGIASIPAAIFGLQNLPGPVGTTLNNALTNAATGNLTEDQVNTLKSQATQSLIQTGVDPNTAQAQASTVVDQALASVTAPGAFGVTWTGAAPSSPNWLTAGITQTAQPATDILTWLEQNWPWLAIGGIGVWWLAKRF